MSLYKKILYTFCTSCRPKQGRTVRYAFPMIFSIAAVLGAATILSQDQSYVRLEASTSKIEEGEWFYVDVYAYAHVAVNAVDIALEFPESKIKVEGIDKGESVITIWTEEPKVEGNKVILRGGTFRKGFKGEHLIATINMRGKATGLAQFDTDGITFLAGDGTGAEVQAKEPENLSIYIYDENTSPEDIGAKVALNVVTDLDGDGKVTLADVSQFMAAWFGGTRTGFDFNKDGRMNFNDFSIILSDSFFK